MKLQTITHRHHSHSVILQIFMVSEMLTTSYLNLVSTQTATMLNGAH